MEDWIDVNDRLPEQKGEYLVVWQTDPFGMFKPFVTCLEWFIFDKTKHGVWVESQYKIVPEAENYVTHWKPLPPPPKTREEHGS